MKVGITGHQNIGSDETVKWVTTQLDTYINQSDIEQAFTSLAIGADQLFAQILKQHNIPFTVVIPSSKYEQTFISSSDLENYKGLLNASDHQIKLPFDEPSETAFYEAGKKIVNLSDMVIAIWDGQPAKGLGGTGDIVKYAHTLKRSVIHINPITRTVSKL